MSYLPKIENLSEKEIDEIIIGKEEGKFLEFKSELKIETTEEKREFLADVSSFSNANGGDLILGVNENNGIATSINGISIENTDKFKQRIENLTRDCISPNIPPIKFQIIKLNSGKYLVAISITESFNKPHSITLNKSLRVYSRNSSGKYPLDIFDIKDIILGSADVLKKINDFRNSRVFSIVNQDLPIKFENGESAKYIIHIIPQQAFIQKLNADLNGIRTWTSLIMPLNADYCQQRLNFEGIYSYTSGSNFSVVTKYFQFFRNGIIESVNGNFTSKQYNIEKGVWGNLISEGAISLVKQAITIYQKLDISPPIYILISLMDIKDHCFILDPSRFPWAGNRYFEQNELICPEVVINDFNVDLKNEFKFIFDMIWNAVGLDRSYD